MEVYVVTTYRKGNDNSMVLFQTREAAQKYADHVQAEYSGQSWFKRVELKWKPVIEDCVLNMMMSQWRGETVTA